MHPKLEKLEQQFNRSILTRIEDRLLDEYQIQLWLKRDDLLHPVISGNKWYKLKYILDHVLCSNMQAIVSMGGAYSNHLHTLAYVGHILDLTTVGIIRGEEPAILNPTLVDMQNWGMSLKFVSRSDYRHFRTLRHWQYLPGLLTEQYWLPEGGARALALKGVAELVDDISIPYDTLCLPCGTGTTLAGIIGAVPPDKSVIGFSALKNSDFLSADIEFLAQTSISNWSINRDYHFGGFAKINAELISFIEEFTEKTAIPLEPVYSGKMMYGLYDLIKQRHFNPGQRIVALHTGGLQGNRELTRLKGLG